MNCPTDGETLLMSERMGVEIDYCPRCRGVWLDRGELDKLLSAVDRDDDERDRDRERGRDREREPDWDRGRDAYVDKERYGDDRGPFGGRRKKKKSSFLGEFFEFGD